MEKNKPVPQPIRGEKGAETKILHNVERDRQNPDMLAPPETDHGTVPNMKFSFSDVHNRLEKGGYAREVTVRELPISDKLASVNMRLKPGAIRELHWHKEAEWAYMLYGKARITSVDQDGRNFIEDVKEGDLWYFPSGLPHSIQALEDGCEFLLVFDDGSFSENSTFQVTDWLAHTPDEVIAANFGISKDVVASLPDQEKYIFQEAIPGCLEKDKVESPNGTVPQSFSYKLLEQEPIVSSGGKVWIADSTNFKASKTIASALVEVEPGGIRELHWHPNTDEWQYYISGQAKMTVFASDGHARTFNYQAGDVGYVPFAMGHYVQNTGDEPLRFLEIFKDDHYADVSLNQWLALVPEELVRQHLDVGSEFTNMLSKEKHPVVKFDKK
ncbi:oxalate decarboxylase family bicupin [Bacillus paralicheniformis]|uniref:oxalate decarboxylase family bicupin n=1 Tax=Bacillus TaxID=1386 RepID=UPI002244814F|nr:MULTISPECIES: oxalate decarboxylase family bicupin [Bacillus]MDN5388581.1 oxalate decarboxylase family bicupin [Bacillus sp. LB7]MEC1034687.1 oxalate decarboxylase family bicupin [Bacillus paralicheniformis]MEC1060900.1 oxalate decarboxylase family bicupin [Bacillus paralicheniformis]MEC1187494.1 oxalate decarboxylase family bicupin [Bacillus paralicheniformis]UZN53941.1 oxalate decarboxylase family bicupin [Bacillus paralicheniformis]